MGDALQEHYGYLSDGARKERFEQAVVCAIEPGDTVADLGCGFGALGLMCLKAGASHVWGIDRTEAIQVARETMSRGGYADRYTCLHQTSFEAELPQPVDVIICDHVGFFGFDYGIVRMMDDARHRLLKPGGKVLPARIVLQAAAVQSAGCRKLADAWTSEPIPAEYAWLREYGVNTRHPYQFSADELASPPAKLGTIDLREDTPDHLAFAAAVVVQRSCELDGLAGWFNCELCDGVWMTNSPIAPDRIDRSQVFLPFTAPLAVEAGDEIAIAISFRHETNQISWKASVSRSGQSRRQSTWLSTILDPLDRAPVSGRRRQLTRAGIALRSLLERIDGQATDSEIEEAVLSEYPNLFPTRDHVVRFVRAELNRNAR